MPVRDLAVGQQGAGVCDKLIRDDMPASKEGPGSLAFREVVDGIFHEIA